MAVRRVARSRGFTLLEVLVAIAILGLSLTVILSAQAGLFSSARRTANISKAIPLARCKMSEVELDLLRDGYPAIEQKEEGPCCDDESVKGFKCEWNIDVVELPDPRLGGGIDAGLDLSTTDTSGLGPVAGLAALQSGSAGIEPGAGLGGLADVMGGAAAAGTQGLAPMVMTMVYPELKPMLEASIRKVTVTVVWSEGRNRRELAVQQFVTNPQQGGLDPNAAEGLGDLADGLPALPGLPTPGARPPVLPGGRP